MVVVLMAVPLSPAALAILERYWCPLLPLDPLFPSPKGSRRGHYSIDGFRAAIRRACKRAEVPEFTPYAVRHAVARRVRKPGNVDALRELLRGLMDRPEQVAELRAGIKPVRTVGDHLNQIEQVYREALDR